MNQFEKAAIAAMVVYAIFLVVGILIAFIELVGIVILFISVVGMSACIIELYWERKDARDNS